MSMVNPGDLAPEVDGDELQAYLETKFGTDQTGGGDVSDTDNPVVDDDNDDSSLGDPEDDVSDLPNPQDGEDGEEGDNDDEIPAEGLFEVEYEVLGPDNQPTTVKATLTKDQLVAFHKFNQRLAADPKLQYWLGAYDPDRVPTPGAHVGEEQPTAPATPPQPVEDTIPEDVDLDDPTIKFLYEQNKKLQEELRAVQGVTAQTYEQQVQAQRQAVDGLIKTAKTSFAESNKLTEEEANKILDVAGRMGAAQTYMAGTDPRTGLPIINPNPIEAVTTAMEMAMWALPEFRNKLVTAEAKTARADRIKKSKLTAISGNSGSTNRSTPAPKNDAELRAAMTAEIAADMGLG